MPLNYNGCELLKLAIPILEQAASKSRHKAKIVVVDNASHDDSESWLKEHYPQVEFLAFEENLKLTTYNIAIEKCNTSYVMILNNDILVTDNFIDPLIERLEKAPEALGVSPRITADHEDEVWQHRLGGEFFHGHLGPKKLDQEAGGTLYLHGAAMMVRRERFLELGGFDSLFFYGEDNDLSYRAWRLGYSCLFEPKSSVHHLGSQSVKKLKDGLGQKRAFKERGNNFFVLKNVQNKNWSKNFIFWTCLKLLKMIVTCDRKRFWAYCETWEHRKVLLVSAKQQPRVDDRQMMTLIQSMVLPELSDEKVQ